jgi:DNA-directed RNA polymerase specialized sigma24 family protein
MTKAKKRIIEQYVSGLRIKDISNDSGWSVGAISQMISRNTFGLREKRIESIEARKINIFNSYKAGKISIKEISNETGLSTPATYTMLSRVRKKIK